MTWLFFLITLSILILVHEWGHFFTAKKLGIRVDEFAMGFPPRVWSFVKNGTRYALNLFPIGGYVKIYGESGEGVGEKESFISRPVWQRYLVVVAGVTMNIVLAWILFSGAHAIGVNQALEPGADHSGAAITIIGIEPNSPAETANIKFGDQITNISFANQNLPFGSIEDVQKIIKQYAGKEITITLTRNNTSRDLTITPRIHPPDGSGALGIALEYIKTVKTPWYLAPVEGVKSTFYASINTMLGFGSTISQLIVRHEVPTELSGPVGIFNIAGDIRELGLSYMLQFIAILSINLAILNSLPIPALDGGRMLLLSIEKMRKKALTPKLEAIIHASGFAFLIVLIILVTIRDIRHLF